MNHLERKSFELHGEICECYFGLGLSMKEIATFKNCTIGTVSAAIKRYFTKPEKTTKIRSGTILFTPSEKKFVFDRQTGVYYNNASEASQFTNIPHKTICNWLSGERNQKSERFKQV